MAVLTIPVILSGEYLKWKSIPESVLHVIEKLMLKRMGFLLTVFIGTNFSSFTEYVILIEISLSPVDPVGSFPSKISMGNVNQSKTQLMWTNIHYSLKTRTSLWGLLIIWNLVSQSLSLFFPKLRELFTLGLFYAPSIINYWIEVKKNLFLPSSIPLSSSSFLDTRKLLP